MEDTVVVAILVSNVTGKIGALHLCNYTISLGAAARGLRLARLRLMRRRLRDRVLSLACTAENARIRPITGSREQVDVTLAGVTGATTARARPDR